MGQGYKVYDFRIPESDFTNSESNQVATNTLEQFVKIICQVRLEKDSDTGLAQ